VSYHPNGGIAQFTYGNGVVHKMTQNTRGLPERSWDVYGTNTPVLDDVYWFDRNGNVEAIADDVPGNRGDRVMAYDDLDRLTAVSSPMFTAAGYTYDALDNLTRVTIGGSAGRDYFYCYDTGWRLTNVKTGSCDNSASVIGLGYDAQGNLNNKNGVAYAFDYGNRLRSVTSSTLTSTYVYDGHGRRVLDATTAGKYSQYTQDGRLAITSDLRANKVADYVYLGGSLVAIRERDVPTGVYTTKYQHTDALGTPVAVTGVAGAVLERSEYEPFGLQINGQMKDGPGYTGHVQDAATGMTYMQQRYYDAQIGRFLSVDPVSARPTGDNFNRYAYAINNPYKFTDPDGRESACFSNGVGCGLAPITPEIEHQQAVAMGGLAATVLTAGLAAEYAPVAAGIAASAKSYFRRTLAQRAGLTRTQQLAIRKIDNIASHHAKPHDFAGVRNELKGVQTGFDHVTEMKNSVNGLTDAVKSLKGSLKNPGLTAKQRATISSAVDRATKILEKMQGALSGN
jgi:RHS repeat-associated protein